MARKPAGSCEDTGELVETSTSELKAQPTKQLPATVEVHDGSFKQLESCSQVDFFNAHLLAKTKAAEYMRSAEFMFAQSEYFKRLSAIGNRGETSGLSQ